jgi:hypothetical protein
MATPLQALERMLLSQERREKSRVEESLGMMQLAQQAAIQKQQLQMSQKQLEMSQQKQNIEIFGSNIESIQKFNETMKIRSAENLLQQTGLSGLYATYKDEEDGLQEFVDELEDIGLDKQIASTLASATYSAYEQNNPNAIINIGSKLHYLDQKDVIPSEYDKKLSTAFTKLGYLQQTSAAQQEDFLKLNRDAINTFKTMRKALDNEVNLSKEISEFARGDYEIQTEFDIIDESLRKVELSRVIPPKPKDKDGDFESILPFDKKIKELENKAQSLQDVANLKKQDLKKYQQGVDLYRIYKQSGIPVSQKDEELYGDSNYESIIKELTREINLASREAREARELETRLGETKRIDFDERIGSIDYFGF